MVAPDRDHTAKTTRFPRLPRIASVVAVLAALIVGTWWGIRSDPVRGVGAGAAILIAAGVLHLAMSIPRKTPQGLLLGVGIPLAAMMAWTHLEQPGYVWAVTGFIGVAAAVLTYPWWRRMRKAARLGGFWLAVSLWVCGSVSALALLRWDVFAGRVVYGGFAIVVALLIFRGVRRGQDISIGIAAGFLVCHAALYAFGAPYVFETGVRHTSESTWGLLQSNRFWGGPALVYHPNFIAMTALLAAIRIGADDRFASWMRWGVLGNAMLLLLVADSRTSLLMAGVASVAYGALRIRRSGMSRIRVWTWFATARARRLLAHAVIPLAATLLVFTAAGGSEMLFKGRYATVSGQQTASQQQEASRNVNLAMSGRIEVWGMILHDFREDTLVEKLFGNADHPRGEIHRYPASDPRSVNQAELSADNVLVGALRRGGVAGLLMIFVAGLTVLWRATRRRTPIWITVVTLAAGASIISEDELVGTTPLWMLVFAGELWMWRRARA